MSTETITDLLEAAACYLDYYEGTVLGAELLHDMDTHDYESLQAHVEEARAIFMEGSEDFNKTIGLGSGVALDEKT